MTLTVEAIYENGVLKPKRPLTIPDGTAVHLIVNPIDYDPLEPVIGIGEGTPDGADRHEKYIYRENAVIIPEGSLEPR
jgi:predicted DNA-binding antitoxin AbrB/MazE fold protein